MRAEAARPKIWIEALGCSVARIGLVGLCVASFCSCRPHSHELHTVAHVRVMNLGDASWEIRISSKGPAAPEIREYLHPREVREVAVPAGEYRLRQTLLATATNESQSREITLQVAGGNSYTWPLATLLTTGCASPGSAPLPPEAKISGVSKN